MKISIEINLIDFDFLSLFSHQIILVNQTSFSFKANECIPSLGDLWSHTAFMKIQFSKVNQNYCCATLQKSSIRPRKQSFFRITVS